MTRVLTIAMRKEEEFLVFPLFQRSFSAKQLFIEKKEQPFCNY